MPLPVLICDDSSMARKQLTRALPDNWDAELSYAENGEQALEQIRAGKADLLLLDLTMPVLDGFGVLQAIRNHDLPTLVIVVSGDIQPESQRKVRELGALAFLKKPVDSELLCQTLEQFGLLQLLEQPAPQPEALQVEDSEPDFNDWCQEVVNISKGRAANLLARTINSQVELSIPRVCSLTTRQLSERLQHGNRADDNYITLQGFTGAGISGEILMDIDSEGTERLIGLLYDEAELREARLEALMETVNLLTGAFLKSLSDTLHLPFSVGQPVLRHGPSLERVLHENALAREESFLAIGFHYTIADLTHCQQYLLFTPRSAEALAERAKVSLE